MPIDMKLVIAGQFKELVRRGNVDKITVKALIEECHISRQTFYYHFQDINDVMEWSVRRETEQLLRQSLELPQLRCGLELLIAHTAGQFDVLHKLLCSHRRQRFTDALTACMRVFLNGLLERFMPNFAVNQPDREVFLDYNSRALTGILLDYCGRRELDAARLSAQLERILLRQLAEPLEEM